MIDNAIKALTAIATAISIAIALGQLTSTVRLRRRESFYREAAGDESPRRRAVLNSLRREAVAILVSRQAVPVREILPAAGLLVFYVFMFYEAGRQMSLWRFDGGRAPWADVGALAAVPLTLALLAFLSQAAATIPRFLYERRRLCADYLAERDLVRLRMPMMLRSREFGTESTDFERDLSWWARQGAPTAFSIGASASAFTVGMIVATPEGHYWYDGLAWPVVLLAFLPPFGIFAGLQALLTFWAESTYEEWRHEATPARTTPSAIRAAGIGSRRPRPMRRRAIRLSK